MSARPSLELAGVSLAFAQAQPPVIERRDLGGQVGVAFEALTAAGTDLSQRTAAALALIATGDDDASLALSASLGQQYPAEVWRATLDAINTTREELPRGELPEVIAGMRTRLPAEIEGYLKDLAQAHACTRTHVVCSAIQSEWKRLQRSQTRSKSRAKGTGQSGSE